MALTTTQVNQAFLGLLGRPATGAEAAKFAGQLDAATLAQTLLTDASFKNELSVETLSFKTVDLLNTDPAAFVESLYTALLGRASDAEGKAFWLSAAGATPNRADVVSQFIAAVQAQEGTADANAFAAIQAEDKALASAWVESLYNNLAGRASDAEGLDFWTNAIVSFTMTPAQVAASFAAALALQGNTTEDGQNFAAKLGVADNFTANFKDFNSLVTANEKAEQLKNLVTMMNGVNKDSQVDQYTQEITKITDEYQKIAAIQFTAADDDNLGIDPETGESNLKGAANFTGTYNLTDPTKGTIQSSDSATGTEAYLTDTLTVNVTGYDKTNRADFNLSDLPSTSSVEKLVINNGAANVNGSVAGDFQYINVNGTGRFEITANTNNALKDVSLNSAASKDGEINTFTTGNALDSIKTGAGDDELIILNTVSKSINTGAGKDTVTVTTLGKNATADLGAGDDTFNGSLDEGAKLNGGAGDDTLNIGSVGKNASISAGTGDDTIKLQQGINHTDGKGNPISTVEIDGGVGKDVIDFTEPSVVGASTDFTGIKSIKGVETIKVLDGIKLKASAISGQKIELDNNGNLILDAKDATSVDLSKLSLADAANVSLQINNLKSNITLKKTDTNSNSHIAETITLDKDAKGIKISNFEVADDVIKISGVDVSADKLGNAVTPVSVERNKIYELTTTDNKQTVTKTNIEDGLLGVDLTNVADGDVFYIARSLQNASGSSNNTVVYKVYVGKAVNGTSKIAKVDTLTTINTKDIDFTKNFVKADDYAEVIAPVNGVVTIPSEGTDPISIKTDNLKNDGTLTISGTGVETKEVIVPSAKGQNINVAVETKVKSLTLGDANETITYTDATKLPETINAGAGNDTIDLSAIAASGNLTVNGGVGRDTLIISGNNTITSLKSVESINISGTSINADALSENNASVDVRTIELVNGKTAKATLTVDASGATSDINLTKYFQSGSGDKAVALDITNVANNVNLNKTGNIAETITLVDTAINDKAVKITGLATGDIVKGGALANTISGPFVLTRPSGENATTTLQGKAAYYIDVNNTDVSTAAKALAALGKVTLANGSEALVAFNTDKGTYIYSVSGAASNLTATNFTLAAIVDDKINNQDSIKNGVITFTANDTPIALKAVTKTFADLGGEPLDLAGDKVDKDANAIIVNGVSGQLTVSGANAQIEKVDAFVTGASGKVTKGTGADNATINLFLGGSENASGTITAGNETFTADLTSTGATNVYINTSNASGITFDNVSNFGGKIVDLKGKAAADVAATVKITTAIEKTGTDNNVIKVSDLFSNVTSNDSITFTAASTATTIEGSSGTDTLVVSGSYNVLTDIKDIDVLTLSGDTTLKAAAITGDTLTINSGGSTKLSVDASGAATVDLGNLQKGNAAVTVNLTNVKAANADITLSAKDQFVETVEVSTNDLNATENIILTNYQSATDKIKIASGAIAGSSGTVAEVQLKTAIGNISYVKAASGVLVLEKSSNTKVDAADATLANALNALNNGLKNSDSSAIFEANDVVLFRDEAANKSYLIGIGQLSNTKDDIVVELVGATSLTSLTDDNSNGFTVTFA
ncbi:DUF4214 domain-containing protein [Campylobacter magnus]|uniref:DUF4214 domain-containing protein n=1 Tax=Campylobacter magnus TaxID=3026462 RepID=UPI0023616238|nr:DUF4214 domain-containing protein [Campylobacter magnus]MDD0855904.1 DUF4214 domain-containing protein [Campylobacter magnus]